MKSFKIFLTISVIALFVFACANNTTVTTNNTAIVNKNTAVVIPAANTQPTAASDELASTKKIYTEKCERCHKANGEGGVTEIDGTKIKAPDFNSDRMKKDKDADWTETIEKGATDEGMPAFKGKISDDEIKNLVKLIRRDFQKQ